MKFIISLFFLIAVIAFQSINAVKICVIHANTCNGKVNVCGRYGRSNLCMKFKNNCDLEASNCEDIAYTAVNATFCNGIPLNQRRVCNGLSSNSKFGGIFSRLFGTTSNLVVTPIIINTAK